VAVTDGANNVAYTESNALGLPIQTWGTAVQPAKTDYDAYGRRTAITTWQTGTFSGSTWPSPEPSGGNTVQWTVDSSTGLATSKSFPNSSAVNFTYNARGQLHTREWARGTTTTYTYFDTSGSQTGELQSQTYSDSTPSVSYTYTRWGAPATVNDASGSRTFDYRSDLKVSTESLDSTFYNGRVLTTTYDPNVPGRPNGYSFNGGVTVGLTLGYDAATAQVSSVTGTLGGASTTFNFGYAAGTDWVDSVTNGSYTRSMPLVQKYDVISSATTTWGGSQLGNFVAKFNDVRGLCTGQDSGSSSGAPAGSWSKVLGLGDGLTFGDSTLDPFGQLTNVPTPSWQGTPGTQSLSARNFGWSYDLAGNRTAETGAAPTTYSTADTNPNAYGSLNEYESITGALGESTLTYDADGNLTQDGTWTYGYDGENRLTSMTRSGQSLSFVYDCLSRRIRKTVAGTGATDLKFVYSGWQLVADLNADGYNITRSYVWGPDFSDARGAAGGAGSLLAIYNPGYTLTYAMPDARGNIVGHIDASGSLLAAVEFTPYGRAINSVGSLGSYPIGYSGHYTDWETGLVYYGCRYYNPKHGRFINRDPIEEQGGLNLYGFCGNNCINRFDSLGMDVYDLNLAPAEYRGEIQHILNQVQELEMDGRANKMGYIRDCDDALANTRNNPWVWSYDLSFPCTFNAVQDACGIGSIRDPRSGEYVTLETATQFNLVTITNPDGTKSYLYHNPDTDEWVNPTVSSRPLSAPNSVESLQQGSGAGQPVATAAAGTSGTGGRISLTYAVDGTVSRSTAYGVVTRQSAVFQSIADRIGAQLDYGLSGDTIDSTFATDGTYDVRNSAIHQQMIANLKSVGGSSGYGVIITNDRIIGLDGKPAVGINLGSYASCGNGMGAGLTGTFWQQIELAAEEEDSGAVVLETPESAGGRFDGLYPAVEAFS
jgi:RHS repeat-associated protein